MTSENTADTATTDLCLICMRPEEPDQRLVLAQATDTHPEAWLCRECQKQADESPDLAEEFRMIAGLPHVQGCHRCGGSENPYFTHTLSLTAFLCRPCARHLGEAEPEGAALLRYMHDALMEAMEPKKDTKAAQG